jgi:DNA-binding FrmR family transcriptional regulator
VHTEHDKEKLCNRVRRIRGQLNAVEKALVEGEDCSTVLHTLTACRGAMDSLLYEIVEGHIRFHIVDPNVQPTSDQAKATKELLDALRSYFK